MKRWSEALERIPALRPQADELPSDLRKKGSGLGPSHGKFGDEGFLGGLEAETATMAEMLEPEEKPNLRLGIATATETVLLRVEETQHLLPVSQGGCREPEKAFRLADGEACHAFP